MKPRTPRLSLAVARPFALVVLLALPAITSCAAVQDALGGAPKPEASITGASLKRLDLQGADLVFDVAITNPYAVALPIARLDYTVASGGRQVVTGVSPEQGTIPAQGTRTIPVAASVTFADLLQVLGGVRPGAVVPYEATLGLTVEPPALEPLRLPLTTTGELPIPSVPSVALRRIRWQDLSFERAQAVLELDLGNTSSFPLDLQTISYALGLGGTQVAQASVADPPELAPGATRTLSIPLTLRPMDLGLAAFEVLRGSSAPYSLTGRIQAATPYGPLELPLSSSGSVPLAR